jgi:hypothetical protein
MPIEYVSFSEKDFTSNTSCITTGSKGCSSIARRVWRPVWRDENYDAIFFSEYELSRKRNALSRFVEKSRNRGNGTCGADN